MQKEFIFTNVLGSFIFNERFDVVDSDGSRSALQKRHVSAKAPGERELSGILNYFRQGAHEFYEPDMRTAITSVRESVSPELLAICAVALIEDLNVAINMLAKRLREWYCYHNPEFSAALEDHEKFAELIQKKDRKTLLREIGVEDSRSMGRELSESDLAPIRAIAAQICSLFEQKEVQRKYLERMIRQLMPNAEAIAGTMITAKLLEQAGSLRRLATMPASTVQLLGAEKALFRHLKDRRSKSPKYGYIFSHPLMSKVRKANRGKAARALADKISIAVKVDYFKGEPIAERLNKELEEKFSKW